MSKALLYHNPRWGKSREAVKLLNDNNIDFNIVEYLKDPLSIDEILALAKKLGKRPKDFIRTSEKDFRDNNTHSVNTYGEFKDIIKNGGFVRCGWDGKQETELKIKEDTKATIRCIPFNENPKDLTCIFSGNEAMHEVIFAKSY